MIKRKISLISSTLSPRMALEKREEGDEVVVVVDDDDDINDEKLSGVR